MFRILALIASVTAAWMMLPACQAHSQVVQLPTFRVFNVSTAVMVPDGGRVRLGGVNRSASGSIQRGVPGLSNIPGVNRLFNNRAIGSSAGSSQVDVTAEIIILEEYEEAVLAEARRRQALRRQEIELEQQADFLSRNIGKRNK